MSEPVAIVIDTDVLPGADGMYRHDVLSEIRLPNQAELYLHPDPCVAELEAVLRECRRVFDYYDCSIEQWSVTEERKLRREAIAKIDEVLK